MPRPNVFPADTMLYSAAEPEGRLFPAGETDPGPAWWDSPGGPPAGSASTVETLKDLIAAQDANERLEATLARKDHDLAVMAKERDDAVSRVTGLESDAAVARAAAAESRAAAEAMAKERDQANQRASAAETKLAKFDADSNGDPGGSTPDAEDPDAAEKAELRAQLKALDQPTPHHKLGVVKLRELVEAATAP